MKKFILPMIALFCFPAAVVHSQVTLSNKANILAYSFPQSGICLIDTNLNTVHIRVPYTTDLTGLVATFVLSPGASAFIGSVPQSSGVSINDFTSPLFYTIVAENGSDTENWTINVHRNGEGLVINEADADQTGTDIFEFVELYDGGTGNTDLTGFIIVFFNGSNDLSYLTSDLTGLHTDERGYFVLGNPMVSGLSDRITAGTGMSFTQNILQNGQDAVALYFASASSFPNNTPISYIGLADALVYDTDDPDDPALLTLLNPGEPQINENQNSAAISQSMQRIPNGSGGKRNTTTYQMLAPTPGASNSPFTGNHFLTFGIPGQIGTSAIDTLAHTVIVEVPCTQQVLSLVPAFSVSVLATVTIAGVPQVSGNTAIDFSSPVTYTITSESGNPQNWLVSVIFDHNWAVNLGQDTALCQGQAFTLNAGSGNSYLWSDYSNQPSLTITSTGDYWVSVTNGNCQDTDTLHVAVNPVPVVDFGAIPTDYCTGDQVILNPGTGSSYLWNDNSTGLTLTATTTGLYSVTITAGGCSGTGNIYLSFEQAPDVYLGNDTVICSGSQITLNAGWGESWLWSDNSTAQFLTVSTSGTYSVTVTRYDCPARDTIVISVDPCTGTDESGTLDMCNIVIVSETGRVLLNLVRSGETPISFTIYDASGKTVSTGIFSAPVNKIIDLSAVLPCKGFYCIVLESTEERRPIFFAVP